MLPLSHKVTTFKQTAFYHNELQVCYISNVDNIQYRPQNSLSSEKMSSVCHIYVQWILKSYDLYVQFICSVNTFSCMNPRWLNDLGVVHNYADHLQLCLNLKTVLSPRRRQKYMMHEHTTCESIQPSFAAQPLCQQCDSEAPILAVGSDCVQHWLMWEHVKIALNINVIRNKCQQFQFLQLCQLIIGHGTRSGDWRTSNGDDVQDPQCNIYREAIRSFWQPIPRQEYASLSQQKSSE